MSFGILELVDKVLERNEAEIELKLFELEDIVSLKEALDGLSRQYAVLEDAIRYFSFDIAAFCSKL